MELSTQETEEPIKDQVPQAWVCQYHTCVRMYDVYTVILAGNCPCIWTHTVSVHGSGQP
jgi:hypothetical protein